MDYYCHKCKRNVEINSTAVHIRCRSCRSSFIEERAEVGRQPNDSLNLLNDLNRIIGNRVLRRPLASPVRAARNRRNPLANVSPQVIVRSPPARATRIRRNPMLNVSPTVMVRSPRVARSRIYPLPNGSQPGAFRPPRPATGDAHNQQSDLMFARTLRAVNLHGGEHTRAAFVFARMIVGRNMSDFAFSDGHLERIISQFEEQDDNESAGIDQEDLDRLPTTKVNKTQVKNKMECVTCMEEFKFDEEVVRLDCLHIFHRACTEPWLLKNNTCPLCRRELDPSKWEEKELDKTIELD